MAREIDVIKDKVPGQQVRGDITVKMAEPGALVGGKIARRHLQISKHSRGALAAQKRQGNSFAKYGCERNSFCNIFRTPLEPAP